MTAVELQELVGPGRVRAPNYFNGRLLSAGDLTDERAAGRALLGRVARAAGAGTAHGFEVAAGGDRKTVLIRPGLALSARGDALELDEPVTLNVVAAAPKPPPAPTGPAGFRRCRPPAAGPTTITNPGLHVLAVAPARGGAGTVATSALGADAASCAVRDDVTGLRFALLPFRSALEAKLRDDPAAAGGDAGRLARFRSRAALACFGGPPPLLPAMTDDPPPAFGAVAGVTDPPLPACHVPLAVLNIAAGGVAFVEMWAARRGLAAPSATGPWAGLLGGRPRTEGEAMVLAFQDQAAALTAGPSPQNVAAEDAFAWLPPVGVLPEGGVSTTPGAPLSAGIDHARFFQSLAFRKPVFVPAGLVPTLYEEAARCPPTPLGGKDKPLVWLYRVRENRKPGAAGRPVILFASGLTRPLEARFDVAEWDYANFT